MTIKLKDCQKKATVEFNGNKIEAIIGFDGKTQSKFVVKIKTKENYDMIVLIEDDFLCNDKTNIVIDGKYNLSVTSIHIDHEETIITAE